MRESVVAVLMSPDFLFRFTEANKAIQPLSDFELANRLSYFLWSSMPDDELLSRAAAGDLHKPAVLVAQARRMLKDARVRGLAVEFGGGWLDFRRFEEIGTVDRDRFPSFTNELRHAMFEEPVRFLMDVIQSNRSDPGLSLCERYVPQSRSRQALRHPGEEQASERMGASTTTPTNSNAAGCCRWRPSLRKTPPACAPAR